MYGKQNSVRNSSPFVQTKHTHMQDVFFAKSPRELQWLVLSTWENLESHARRASVHACAIVLLMLANAGKFTLIKGRIIPWEGDHKWINYREWTKRCHASLPPLFPDHGCDVPSCFLDFPHHDVDLEQKAKPFLLDAAHVRATVI